MPNGWVQVIVPDALAARAARWRVRAGEATARAGERLPVAPGEVVVRIEAEVTLPTLWARGTLSVPVHVEPGSLTRVNVSQTLRLAQPLLALL